MIHAADRNVRPHPEEWVIRPPGAACKGECSRLLLRRLVGAVAWRRHRLVGTAVRWGCSVVGADIPVRPTDAREGIPSPPQPFQHLTALGDGLSEAALPLSSQQYGHGKEHEGQEGGYQKSEGQLSW